MKQIVIGTLLLLFFAMSVSAMPHDEGCGDGGDRSGNDCARCHTLSIDEANRILAGVGTVKSVKLSAVLGLYEVALENKEKQGIAYIDFAKKHLVAGPIFSLATKQQITGKPGSTPPVTPQKTKVDINTLPLKDSIVLGNPKGKKKLFVFTDPECPYCKKLHWELVKLIYMEPDLAIYVKMFPLKMHPHSYDKARVILGAGTPYLLDKAFAGEQLPQPGLKDPKEPVDESIKLGESLGITSTPTLVLPDGRIIVGARDAAEIKKLLDEKR